MTYCGEQVAVKREDDGYLAVSLLCRSWTCPDCVDQRKRQLVAEGIGGQPTTFLTLTTRRRAGVTPYQAAREISKAWRLLRLQIQRKHGGEKLPFLAVMEKHKSGWPHLHIMMRSKYIAWKWLKFRWLRLTKSSHVHIQKISNAAQIAGYCAKYCTKCVEKIGTAKRYWQSRDYDTRPPHPEREKLPPGYGWEVKTMSLMDYVHMANQLEWTVISQSSRSVWVYVDDG